MRDRSENLRSGRRCDVRLVRRTVAHADEAGKNDAGESEEFHGAAPVGLKWFHDPATQESETAADSCNACQARAAICRGALCKQPILSRVIGILDGVYRMLTNLIGEGECRCVVTTDGDALPSNVEHMPPRAF
jgi:hypothetical protein